MKILFLDQTAELGGAELSLFSEVTGLAHDGTVLLFEDGPFRVMLEGAGVAVEVVGSAGAIRVRKDSGVFAAVRAAPAVLVLVWRVAARARAYDLIYANSQKAFLVGALAAALTGRRLVWRLRDVLDASHFSAPLRRVVVWLANWKASRVIANSAATGRAFVAVGGDARKVVVVHPGIDEAPFAAVTDDEVAACRAAMGAGDAKLVGVFGRLSEWKGQMVFVEAIARLPDVVVVIVGGALFGEAVFEAALRARIFELGIEGRVRMLGFRDDIPLLMRSMDVIVHCSVAPEPFGRVVVEGMLAGKPVVASDAGGVREIIEDGVTGFLVAPGDVEALVDGLGGVLVRDASGRMSAAGQARARATFTIAATVGCVDRAIGAV